MKTKHLNYEELKQRCDDLEYMLSQYVRERDISRFESYIWYYFFDPIAFELEIDKSGKKFDAVYRRLRKAPSKFADELMVKIEAYNNAMFDWRAWEEWCNDIEKPKQKL